MIIADILSWPSLTPPCLTGPAVLHDLPSDVGAGQSGRAVSAAPQASTWLLRVNVPDTSEHVYVDVAKKGRLLTAQQCAEMFPSMQQVGGGLTLGSRQPSGTH